MNSSSTTRSSVWKEECKGTLSPLMSRKPDHPHLLQRRRLPGRGIRTRTRTPRSSSHSSTPLETPSSRLLELLLLASRLGTMAARLVSWVLLLVFVPFGSVEILRWLFCVEGDGRDRYWSLRVCAGFVNGLNFFVWVWIFLFAFKVSTVKCFAEARYRKLVMVYVEGSVILR